MKNLNLPVSFLCGIVFLIPFYRVQIQYDFRFYVGILYLIYVLSNNNILITVSRYIHLKTHFAFYLWVFITAFFTVNIDFSIQYLVNYFFVSIFFLLVIHFIDTYQRVIFISKVILASFVLQLFIVTMQFLGYEEFYLNDIENIGLNTGITDANVSNVRYWGSFGEALVLSTYLATIGIGLTVYMISVYRRKFFTYALLCFTIFCIYLTGSRAGLSIFVIVMGVFLVRSRIINRPLLVAVLSLFAIAGYYFFDLVIQADANLARFSQLREGDMRFKLWTDGFSIIVNSPWVGSAIGCLNYSLKYYNILPAYVSNINASGHVENSYLTILFSTGIMGFVLFVGIVRYPFVLMKNYHLKKMYIDKPYRNVLRAFTYSYTTILLCMVTEPSVGIHMLNTMLFLLINGLICCLVNVGVIMGQNSSLKVKTNSYQPSIEMASV